MNLCVDSPNKGREIQKVILCYDIIMIIPGNACNRFIKKQGIHANIIDNNWLITDNKLMLWAIWI